MVIQLRGIPDEFIEQLKRDTGEKTAAGAFSQAGTAYALHKRVIDDQESEINVLRYRLDLALEVIEGARTAAALLLDRTAQENLDLPEGH